MDQPLHPQQTSSDTIAIVMPALNEEAAVGKQVRALREHPALSALPICRVLVVDNGSDDATAEVARAAGAEVVREPRRGYGYACLAGVRAATDASVILLMDADGSDDPAGAARVAELVLSGTADLAMGSRTRGNRELGALTPQQRAGNTGGALLLRLLYGLRVSDIGPVRAIRRETLLGLDMREMAYGWSAEMLAKAARAGLRVREAPVNYRRRAGGKSKVAGTLRGTLRASHHILRTLLRYRAWTPPAFDTDGVSPAHDQNGHYGLLAIVADTSGSVRPAAGAAGSAPTPGAVEEPYPPVRSPNALFIVARVPVPGQTKTRLGRYIGHDAAARLYAAFLRDLGERFTATARREGYDFWWYYAAPDGLGADDFATHVPPGGDLLRQQDADLGERLRYGFRSLAARGYERIVVLGSDSPHVPASTVADAFAALETHDVVLGPARDGGYYLLGQRSTAGRMPYAPTSATFQVAGRTTYASTDDTFQREPYALALPADLFTGIPMSTPRVCELTLARARSLGLSVALAPVTGDVDEPPDLVTLHALLRAAPSREADPAPATLALLETLMQPEEAATTPSIVPGGALEGVAHGGA